MGEEDNAIEYVETTRRTKPLHQAYLHESKEMIRKIISIRVLTTKRNDQLQLARSKPDLIVLEMRHKYY